MNVMNIYKRPVFSFPVVSLQKVEMIVRRLLLHRALKSKLAVEWRGNGKVFFRMDKPKNDNNLTNAKWESLSYIEKFHNNVYIRIITISKGRTAEEYNSMVISSEYC